MNFTIHLYLVQSPLLNANIIAFNTHVESPFVHYDLFPEGALSCPEEADTRQTDTGWKEEE